MIVSSFSTSLQQFIFSDDFQQQTEQ